VWGAGNQGQTAIIAMIGTELFVAERFADPRNWANLWRLRDGSVMPQKVESAPIFSMRPWGSMLQITYPVSLGASAMSLLSPETGALTPVGYGERLWVRNAQEAYGRESSDEVLTRWNWDGTTLTSTKAASNVGRWLSVVLVLPNHLLVRTPQDTLALCTYSEVPCENMTPFPSTSSTSSLFVADGFVYGFSSAPSRLVRCTSENFEQGGCSWQTVAPIPAGLRLLGPDDVQRDEQHIYLRLVDDSNKVSTIFRIAK
jgi:hypothetical protein